MRGVFIFAVSTTMRFFSSGASIEVSPVEPMISTADVPCCSWNFSKVRNAPKSTEPSLLKGVISATNEPVSIFVGISVSLAKIQAIIPRRRPLTHAPSAGLFRGGQFRRREGAQRRRGLIPALDLDQRGERARALRERRGADVEGEHVGIAVPLGFVGRI